MEAKQPSMWQSATAAAFGGLCNVFAGQPFDTIKVRLQTQSGLGAAGLGSLGKGAGPDGAPPFRGALDCFVKTVRQEGVTALYKGTSAAFMSIMTENVVLLTANTGVKKAYTAMRGGDRPLTLSELAVCGGVSGIFSATAITPAEVVKCRLQVSRGVGMGGAGLAYTGPIDCITKTVRSEGIAGLFKGLGSVLVRDLPFNFVFLGSYEAAIVGLIKMRGDGATKETLTPLEILTAGGLAGTVGWAVVFPVDVVKSRLQTMTTKGSMAAVARGILVNEGASAFYKGCSAALLRAFPANAGLFFGYEMAQRHLFGIKV